jgi:hypothetical protein
MRNVASAEGIRRDYSSLCKTPLSSHPEDTRGSIGGILATLGRSPTGEPLVTSGWR